jgi:beta-lactamase regulating signal transducer with metallopeptidase domain
MFALRGLAVSFSVFAIVYCALSIVVTLAWRRVWVYSERFPVHQTADLLFVTRLFPFITACVITAAFTVPSFVLLEPRSIDEPIGGIPLVFGLFGVLLGICGLLNTGLALRRASRTVSAWMNDAQSIEAAPVPVLRIPRSFPAMIATGIVRPKVLLSSAAEFVLNASELQTAMNHEMAHVHRRDNLRKLLLRFVAFPGMRELESAWLEATEMAADDAAVSNAGEALDLAAALIKLSRVAPAESSADLTAALVQSPASVMNARVERLIVWADEPSLPRPTSSARYAIIASAATLAAFAITYSQLLIRVHTATEWLVR